MTLILGERAFVGCPKLRRFGTSDTSKSDTLVLTVPGAVDIGKAVFERAGVQKLDVSSPQKIIMDGYVGITTINTQNNTKIVYTNVRGPLIQKHTIQGNAEVLYNNVVGPLTEEYIISGNAIVLHNNVSGPLTQQHTVQGNADLVYDTINGQILQKTTTSGNLTVTSNNDKSSGEITLDVASINGSVTLESLRQIVLLSTPNLPLYPLGKTLDNVFATATRLQSLSIVVPSFNIINTFLSIPTLKKLRMKYSSTVNISNMFFADNTQLEELALVGIVNTIGEFAFAGCTTLKKLQIGAVADTVDVAIIKRGAFYKCSQLTTIKLTDRLKEIGDVAFMDSGVSGEMIIPKNVSTHGAAYFLRCNNLTKLTYLCNLLEFVDPTTISFSKMASLTAISANQVLFELNGAVTIYPGPDVTPHTFGTYDNGTYKATTVNNAFFNKKYNETAYTKRVASYKTIVDKLYGALRNFDTIDSLLQSSVFVAYKAAAATANKANTLISILNEMREVYEDFTDYMQEGVLIAETSYHEIPIPVLPSDMTEDTKFGNAKLILAELSTLGTAVSSAIVNIVDIREAIQTEISTLYNANQTIFEGGTIDTVAPYSIHTSTSSSSRIEITVATPTIEDYTGDSTIVKERGGTYMKYSAITSDNHKRLAAFGLTDGTHYTVDGWFYFRMDSYFSKHHISVLEIIIDMIRQGSYDNKDIDYSFTASKIIKINSLKGYTNVTISITAPSIIIGPAAMEEYSDSRITLNAASQLRIEDSAFGACQNSTLNISAGGDLICGSEILAHSSLITINTNKELINIPEAPIILNNIDVQYWDKTIPELLEIIKEQTDIDTALAYNVEYTTFTAVGSVTPIFAVSFRTKHDLKEYTVIIPPHDYYWALSIGELHRDNADFKMADKNLVFYPDAEMRAKRNRDFTQAGDRAGYNKDGYGLTNSFAPQRFTYKGYTFVQTEKVNNRSLRQVCSNNGEALSERRKNNIIDTIFFVLDIISLITIVIPIGNAVSKAATYAVKGIIAASKAAITILTRMSRIGRLLVKTADIIADAIRNSRVFIKAGNTKRLAQISRKVATCGREAVCALPRKATAATRRAYLPEYARKATRGMPVQKLSDDAVEIIVDVGDAGLDVGELVRTSSVKSLGPKPTCVKFNTTGNVTSKTIGKSAAKKGFAKTVVHAKGTTTTTKSATKRIKLADRIGKTEMTTLNSEYSDVLKTVMGRQKPHSLTPDSVQALLSRSNIVTTSSNAIDVTRTLSSNISRNIRFPAWKKWAIGTGVGISMAAVAIGVAVGVTKKKGARSITRNIVNDSSTYITTINGIMSTFESTAIAASTPAAFAASKAQLITNITAVFTANTDLTQADATRLVTAMVDYMTADGSQESYSYYDRIITMLTEIINTNEDISSEEASDMLDMIISFLNDDSSSLKTNEKMLENFTGPNKLYGPRTVNGVSQAGFEQYSVKQIAMFNILENLYTLGIPPTTNFTEGGINEISASDPAAMYLPADIDELIQNTRRYDLPPYVSPLPSRTGNIRSVEDTYKDGLVRVTVLFGADTEVSYTVNETWKDKFDVSIDKPSRVVIIRKGVLSNVTLNSVKFVRIISPSFTDVTSAIRSYNSPDKVEYCIEPPTWLALDTYIGLGARYQQNSYTDRDSYGHINGPYTTANPLLLSDNYMWNYTMLRTTDVADNGDFAALQVPYVDTNDTFVGVGDPKHKSGLYMGWNSVKYALSTTEDSVVNVALGTSSDLVINYVNSTVTSIPAYAYSSPGIMPVLDAEPFSVAGITLPNTVTSIGKKAFYRSGLNYAIIPSNIRSIAQQAFAESGLTAVKFVDAANITMIPGGETLIAIRNDPIYTDLYDAASFRGEMKYTRGDVMIMNPSTFTINPLTPNQTVYNNPQFVLMLRATINNLEYAEGPGVTKIGQTIFNQLFVNFGWVKAEGYIISGGTSSRSSPRAIEDSIDIGPNAFADNTSLETLVLPDTIRNIGDGAFAGCTALTTIELPPLKSIGDNVFADCTALTQVTFPPNIESIGAKVFENCPALSTIKFKGTPPSSIDPGFFTSIASLSNPISIIVPPQYAPALINAIKSSGISLGSSSTNITLAVDTNGITPYFPMFVSPSTSRVKESLFVYSNAAMESLKAGLAIDPDTKYVTWLAGGAAYDGMLIRPLGRKIHIYTTDRRPLLKYVFMNVQLLSTAIVPRPTDREPYLTGWVCTFAADGIYPHL